MSNKSLDLKGAESQIVSQINTYANLVINNTKKLKMEYTDNQDGTITTINNDISQVKAKNKEKGYIYFLFDDTGKFCLYIGKSNDLRERLKQHLDKPNPSTNSKYSDVVKYVQRGKTTIYFDYLKVTPEDLYGAAEGQFIAFFESIHESNNTIEEFWNKRHD